MARRRRCVNHGRMESVPARLCSATWMEKGLFKHIPLSEPLIRDLGRQNPWWSGSALPQLPPTRRHLVGQIQRRLDQRVAPIVVVRGPRQIGKTVAQYQVIEDLLKAGVPPQNVLRVQADEIGELRGLREPILRIVDWYEGTILGKTLNDAARGGEKTYLFLDEVQNLPDWATQLKSLVDSSTTQAVVTGSSALRIERGRDSLAGRIHTLEAGTLSLTEIARVRGDDLGEPFLGDNGLQPLTDPAFWHDLQAHGNARAEVRDRTFRAFSERGGYPLVHLRASSEWSLLADQLNETVIRRVIKHDLRVGDRGRKRDSQLLEEIFRLCCRYAGQAPAIQLFMREAQRSMGATIGPQRIRHYIGFLAETLLIRTIQPLEIRLKKQRGNAKICLADHGLRASWLQEQVPLDPESLRNAPHLADLAGHLAESIGGTLFSTITALDVNHYPARSDEPEVDFVLTVGTRRIPVEIKYRHRIDPLRDTESLRTFVERSVNNAPFGLLVTQTEDAGTTDPRIVPISLRNLLLLR